MWLDHSAPVADSMARRHTSASHAKRVRSGVCYLRPRGSSNTRHRACAARTRLPWARLSPGTAWPMHPQHPRVPLSTAMPWRMPSTVCALPPPCIARRGGAPPYCGWRTRRVPRGCRRVSEEGACRRASMRGPASAALAVWCFCRRRVWCSTRSAARASAAGEAGHSTVARGWREATVSCTLRAACCMLACADRACSLPARSGRTAHVACCISACGAAQHAT